MSCEQLREDINQKSDLVPKGNKSDLLASAWVLLECCPNRRNRLTHTSQILNAEKDTLADSNWQDAKQTAESILDSLQ